MVNTTKRIWTHVVEASVNGAFSMLTSTIRGSEKRAWVSRESLDDVAICRESGRFRITDVQVDGRRAVVVNDVLTRSSPRQGSGQDSGS